MPDNQNQDWTDDAAFWDEAWGDMSARLDQAERKRFFLWWRAIGIGLLALVPIILFYYWQGSRRINPSYETPASKEAPAAEIIASTPTTPQEAALPLGSESEQDAPSAPPVNIESISSPTSPKQPATPNQSTVTSSVVTAVANPGPPATTPPAEASQQSKEENIPEPASIEPTVSVSEPVAVEEPIVRDIPAALPLLGTPAIGKLNWERPSISPGVIPSRKTYRKTAFGVEAGLNTGGIPDFGGEFVGLRYAIPLSNKWSLPIGLRYQHHNWRISSLDNSVDFEQVADPGNPNQDGTNFLNSLSTVELDRVITNQITLRTGLEYRAGKRLTLFGGTGIHYVLSGQGPSSDVNGFRLVRLDFNRGSNDEDALASSGGNVNRDGNPVTANSLGLSLYTGAGYRIGNRWTVFSELSLLTTPIYQGQPASVERSRIGLGIRYRLK